MPLTTPHGISNLPNRPYSMSLAATWHSHASLCEPAGIEWGRHADKEFIFPIATGFCGKQSPKSRFPCGNLCPAEGSPTACFGSEAAHFPNIKELLRIGFVSSKRAAAPASASIGIRIGRTPEFGFVSSKHRSVGAAAYPDRKWVRFTKQKLFRCQRLAAQIGFVW